MADQTNLLQEAIELLTMELGRSQVEREEASAASRDQGEDYETLDTLAGRIEGLSVAITQLRALLDPPAARGVEQDRNSGRWYVTEDGERLHGPYMEEREARSVSQ